MRFYFRARAIFSPLHAPIPRQESAEIFFHKTVVSDRLARRNRSKSSESVKSDSIRAHRTGPKMRRRDLSRIRFTIRDPDFFAMRSHRGAGARARDGSFRP